MSVPLVLRSEAEAEFDDAFDYYEAQSRGLGVDFLEKVNAVFNRISANPRMHAVVFEDVRKAVVKRFPYSVYYRAEVTRIQVIAVFHDRRDPAIWQRRV